MSKSKNKPASYRNGIAWIANNDEPDCFDAEVIASYISTLLLADLFNKDPLAVANAIIRYRQQHQIGKVAKPTTQASGQHHSGVVQAWGYQVEFRYSGFNLELTDELKQAMLEAAEDEARTSIDDGQMKGMITLHYRAYDEADTKEDIRGSWNVKQKK